MTEYEKEYENNIKRGKNLFNLYYLYMFKLKIFTY